jgi:hypothetical protein
MDGNRITVFPRDDPSTGLFCPMSYHLLFVSDRLIILGDVIWLDEYWTNCTLIIKKTKDPEGKIE